MKKFPPLVCLALFAFKLSAHNGADLTELAPGLLLFATSSGNVIASVGPDGALLIGTPSAASTQEISRVLDSHAQSPARYVVIWPEDLARSEGDAGWGRRGAFVAMHEKALEKLGGHSMGTAMPLPKRLLELGVDRPRVAFSEVLTFDLNGEATHVVHQPPGYSNADAIAHFHRANLIYLGEVFPGDGYPEFNASQGGKLDGLLKTLNSWAGESFRIIPARGKLMTGADIKEFHDMIVTVRQRVQRSVAAGHSETQVVAEHPSAEFDARWGHGRVPPDVFVEAIYRSFEPAPASAK